MLIPSLLLAAVLALLAWFVRNDRAEYAAFKALTRTEDRQRVAGDGLGARDQMKRHRDLRGRRVPHR